MELAEVQPEDVSRTEGATEDAIRTGRKCDQLEQLLAKTSHGNADWLDPFLKFLKAFQFSEALNPASDKLFKKTQCFVGAAGLFKKSGVFKNQGYTRIPGRGFNGSNSWRQHVMARPGGRANSWQQQLMTRLFF